MRQKRLSLVLTREDVHLISGMPIRSFARLERGSSNCVKECHITKLAKCLKCTIADIYNHTQKNYLPPTSTGLGKLLQQARINQNLSLYDVSKIQGVPIGNIRLQENTKSHGLHHLQARMLSDVFCLDKKSLIQFLRGEKEPLKSAFGRNLRDSRLKILLSIPELAKCLSITKQVIHQYQQGECFPSKNTLRSMAFHLGIDFRLILSWMPDSKTIQRSKRLPII
ncbi:MAG TPA: XRE family transcriptional regulator [Lutibacter sp.]|nr:XRE family transcriptional regulator [Lutibacter sp.]